MTGEEIIREIQETYAEWFEMTDKPQELLLGILASRLAGSVEHVNYLEKRLDAYEYSRH